jgi:hypothetical protein
MEQNFDFLPKWVIPVIIILVVWDAVWKIIAMWRAARNNQLAWFICLAIFNTIGILPIIYLLIQKEKTGISEKS